MFGHSNAEVLVVGAGPVGLFASLWLLHRGVKPRIIDKEQGRTTRSYSLALHARSMELMNELGLADKILEHSLRLDRIGLYDGNEQRGEIDLSTLPSEFAHLTVLPQSRLEQLLIDALDDRGISVEWHRRLARVSQRDDHVVATVEKLDKDSVGYAISHTEMVVLSARDMKVPFVLAADGHNSVIRLQLGIEFPSLRPPLHIGVLEFTPKAAPAEPRIVVDEKTTNVLWPLPGERYRWSLQIPDKQVRELFPHGDVFHRGKDRMVLRLGSQDFVPIEVEQIDEWIGQRAPWFHTDMRQIHWHFAVRFEHRHADAFGEGRIWLAGDAAHLTGPVGGQSMNVGLREAANLGDRFAGILHDNESMTGLARYNDKQLAEWNFLLGATGKPTALAKASPWIAKRAKRLLPCLPASGSHLDHLLEELGLRG